MQLSTSYNLKLNYRWKKLIAWISTLSETSLKCESLTGGKVTKPEIYLKIEFAFQRRISKVVDCIQVGISYLN